MAGMHTTNHDDHAIFTDATTTPATGIAAGTPTESRLRLVLTTNAVTSGLGGLAALALGGPVDSVLGTDAVGWVRVVGAGLVAFAAFVAFVSRSRRARLVREVPIISAGDLAWVAGTMVTIALGWYSASGNVVMGAVAAMVGAFGLTQAVLVRRLRSDD